MEGGNSVADRVNENSFDALHLGQHRLSHVELKQTTAQRAIVQCSSFLFSLIAGVLVELIGRAEQKCSPLGVPTQGIAEVAVAAIDMRMCSDALAVGRIAHQQPGFAWQLKLCEGLVANGDVVDCKSLLL